MEVVPGVIARAQHVNPSFPRHGRQNPRRGALRLDAAAVHEIPGRRGFKPGPIWATIVNSARSPRMQSASSPNPADALADTSSRR